MSQPARADSSTLIATLRARRLDGTLTRVLPSTNPLDEQASGRTGIPVLDRRLGGGLPRGHLSEVVGPQSSGRTSLMLQAMAAATARGELVALVDALDMLDVESLVAAGVDCSRLLWVRGHAVVNPGLCRDLNQRAMEQAIKALGLVLQAGNFGLVVLDIGDAPDDAVRRLPFTTWLRLQRMIESSQTIGLLVGRTPMSRSSAGLTIALQHARGGRHGPARFTGALLDGLAFDLRIARARVHASDSTECRLDTRAAHHG
jgi:recombination protein RecA